MKNAKTLRLSIAGTMLALLPVVGQAQLAWDFEFDANFVYGLDDTVLFATTVRGQVLTTGSLSELGAGSPSSSFDVRELVSIDVGPLQPLYFPEGEGTYIRGALPSGGSGEIVWDAETMRAELVGRTEWKRESPVVSYSESLVLGDQPGETSYVALNLIPTSLYRLVGTGQVAIDLVPVPEPEEYAMLSGLGLGLLGIWRRYRKTA